MQITSAQHDRMTGLDANGTITVLKYSLSSAQDLFTQYEQIRGSQAGPINNAQILRTKKVDLQNELTDLVAQADTLNTEFTDRSAAENITKLQSWGVSTKQDWVLLIFFASYALACIVVMIYTVMASATKIRAAAIIAIVSIIFGIGIGGVIKYFA